MADNRDYIGMELKYKVVLTSLGFSMQDDDFQIEVSVGSKKVLYKKEDLLRDLSGNFYIAIDTTPFKKGDLNAVSYLYVPDDDFPDGLRTEMVKTKLTTLWDAHK